MASASTAAVFTGRRVRPRRPRVVLASAQTGYLLAGTPIEGVQGNSGDIVS